MHSVSPFDLIHAHGALPCGHAAMCLSKSLKIPFVVTVHGLDAFSDKQASGTVGSWCRRISQDVYRSAKTVICISDKVRESVGRATANSVVVHNGVDPEMFFPAAETGPATTVLSVGNLIPIKGHALLIRAFARVLHVVPGTVLEIIGDGPERERLVRLARELGIAKQVLFRGRQSRSRTAEAMRHCAVFALPSHYEGLGCVYLEAMACAKPAIGCHSQGISEIIDHGKNGFLVEPGSEAELSDLLAMLLRNGELRRRTARVPESPYCRSTPLDIKRSNWRRFTGRVRNEAPPGGADRNHCAVPDSSLQFVSATQWHRPARHFSSRDGHFHSAVANLCA